MAANLIWDYMCFGNEASVYDTEFKDYRLIVVHRNGMYYWSIENKDGDVIESEDMPSGSRLEDAKEAVIKAAIKK